MGSAPTRKIWRPVKPRHVHVSIKLDTSNGHSRATRRQAAVIGGLLSRKCRCQAFMPIEAEFWKSNNRKPKNKPEDEAEYKTETYNKSLTHLVPHFILGLIDMVQRLQKLCIYRNMPRNKSRNRYLIYLYNHDLTIAVPNNLFLLKLHFQVMKYSKALNRRCTIWIGPTSHGILSSVIFPHHYPASLRGSGLQV